MKTEEYQKDKMEQDDHGSSLNEMMAVLAALQKEQTTPTKGASLDFLDQLPIVDTREIEDRIREELKAQYEARLNELTTSNRRFAEALEKANDELTTQDETISELLATTEELSETSTQQKERIGLLSDTLEKEQSEKLLVEKDNRRLHDEQRSVIEEVELLRTTTDPLQQANQALTLKVRESITKTSEIQNTHREEVFSLEEIIRQVKIDAEQRAEIIRQKDLELKVKEADNSDIRAQLEHKDKIIQTKTGLLDSVIPQLKESINGLVPLIEDGKRHKAIARKMLEKYLPTEKVEGVLNGTIQLSGVPESVKRPTILSDIAGSSPETTKRSQHALDTFSNRAERKSTMSSVRPVSTTGESTAERVARIRAEQQARKTNTSASGSGTSAVDRLNSSREVNGQNSGRK